MSDLRKLEEGRRTWARDLDRHLAKERPGHLESLGQRGRLLTPKFFISKLWGSTGWWCTSPSPDTHTIYPREPRKKAVP